FRFLLTRVLRSFPTRRSSDLGDILRIMRARLTKDFTFEAAQTLPNAPEGHKCRGVHGHSFKMEVSVEGEVDPKTGWVYDHANIRDRKSTRLNSSHRTISYAVF